jgi:hypothetical protein
MNILEKYKFIGSSKLFLLPNNLDEDGLFFVLHLGEGSEIEWISFMFFLNPFEGFVDTFISSNFYNYGEN